ncbi:MAG: hypothetical protein QQM50_05280 [Dehalococcoides mccartyi]|jgi:hypothetical protein|uniref:Uncharacterized protein n=3 Tax=root TaxID=1 RepID=A0A0V8M4D0_9CHLR|nr:MULTISPECIES: hypothetical protein [Dehalococcoides]AAW40154.1 hypothetical protein DET0575 [Dehalococcoides mccartyi 195]AQU02965.1 hypothetical protein B1773_02585 [Dehalococcoides mccartyi]AQU04282.1 hypothetical protein B1774_02335 [Dehalococcoides mccartyi]KSV18619.1 hypothetical protein DA01_01200 [Dehalococcoides mccartyi]MCF7634995.1 hypothetical protein [Dehalococcoides mccartyi]
MRSRYPVLQFIIIVLKILAVLIALAGLVMSIYVMTGQSVTFFEIASSFSVFAGIMGILGSLITGVLIFASAELMQCLIDIERNTRKTARLLNTN